MVAGVWEMDCIVLKYVHHPTPDHTFTHPRGSFMSKTTIGVRPGTKERFLRFLKTEKGMVSHDDAINSLLDNWQENHEESK